MLFVMMWKINSSSSSSNPLPVYAVFLGTCCRDEHLHQHSQIFSAEGHEMRIEKLDRNEMSMLRWACSFYVKDKEKYRDKKITGYRTS